MQILIAEKMQSTLRKGKFALVQICNRQEKVPLLADNLADFFTFSAYQVQIFPPIQSETVHNPLSVWLSGTQNLFENCPELGSNMSAYRTNCKLTEHQIYFDHNLSVIVAFSEKTLVAVRKQGGDSQKRKGHTEARKEEGRNMKNHTSFTKTVFFFHTQE